MIEEKNDLEFWKKVVESEEQFTKMMIRCQYSILKLLIDKDKRIDELESAYDSLSEIDTELIGEQRKHIEELERKLLIFPVDKARSRD